LQTRVKGTFILKQKGRFFKVITVAGAGNNRYIFECRDIESRQRQVLTYEMLGLLEAVDRAAVLMRDPKDILLLDLDNEGAWKVMTRDQIDRILENRRHESSEP
jgi:hypothetical protein